MNYSEYVERIGSVLDRGREVVYDSRTTDKILIRLLVRRNDYVDIILLSSVEDFKEKVKSLIKEIETSADIIEILGIDKVEWNTLITESFIPACGIHEDRLIKDLAKAEALEIINRFK